MTNRFAYCILLLASLFLSFTGCQKQKTENQIPPRPLSAPASSIWVGGLDGGVFVLVRKSEGSAKGIYHGEIYYTSGDLSYKGPLKILPSEDSTFNPEDTKSYEGWDGDTLYLTNGRRLLAVEEDSKK